MNWPNPPAIGPNDPLLRYDVWRDALPLEGSNEVRVYYVRCRESFTNSGHMLEVPTRAFMTSRPTLCGTPSPVMALYNGADIYDLKLLMRHANITTREISFMVAQMVALCPPLVMAALPAGSPAIRA